MKFDITMDSGNKMYQLLTGKTIGGVCVGGGGLVCENTLHQLLNFSADLKLFQKRFSFEKQTNKTTELRV